ncbi:SGNH/GDSL hydrolase family protein [Nostoc sp. CMAA1605]|uniref:SGNH/GDSL hydrolase family protein n=1 Tax=Nostoc sp. CMAA1605 TaxID=2055159 RepID=UPI001F2E5894|nr:SGNH/GDSL hydrolase family protein [Nostoc sp. CMAA1605]MCF4969710.1 G-D-S-L family lipolytic protein [Nostoc sp. CMAA1605]
MSTTAKTFPVWAFFLLATNGILMLAVILLIWRQQGLTAVSSNAPPPVPANQNPPPTPELGPRHQLTYQQWVDILNQEAQVTAQQRPSKLSVLVGDSLSLWFPVELLPQDRNWLNQAISGETSNGLLKRLNLFDQTQPETIFVMIGINDLIRGVDDQVILDNQRQIIIYLRKNHPKTKIFIQSILPHGGAAATWEGKEKLLAIPNSRIEKLNQQLRSIAVKEGVEYLDLYSLFADQKGNMRTELTTDGLHLSPAGYLVWRTALQIYQKRGGTGD